MYSRRHPSIILATTNKCTPTRRIFLAAATACGRRPRKSTILSVWDCMFFMILSSSHEVRPTPILEQRIQSSPVIKETKSPWQNKISEASAYYCCGCPACRQKRTVAFVGSYGELCIYEAALLDMQNSSKCPRREENSSNATLPTAPQKHLGSATKLETPQTSRDQNAMFLAPRAKTPKLKFGGREVGGVSGF